MLAKKNETCALESGPPLSGHQACRLQY